jgi:hypothetical protein
LVGLDFNYRRTLWPLELARRTLARMVGEHVDILITTVQDMAQFYGFRCGRYSVRQLVEERLTLSDDESSAPSPRRSSARSACGSSRSGCVAPNRSNASAGRRRPGAPTAASFVRQAYGPW